MRILFSLLVLMTVSTLSYAQEARDSELFLTMKTQDSLLFTKGFNLCDIAYLEKTVSNDLKFYHDQSGFQDREVFFKNVRENICSTPDKKPIRKVDENSLVVYPLYDNGVLYGAVQHGVHDFYIKEVGKEDTWTSRGDFTHVWILKGAVWQLDNVLSYNHRSTR